MSTFFCFPFSSGTGVCALFVRLERQNSNFELLRFRTTSAADVVVELVFNFSVNIESRDFVEDRIGERGGLARFDSEAVRRRRRRDSSEPRESMGRSGVREEREPHLTWLAVRSSWLDGRVGAVCVVVVAAVAVADFAVGVVVVVIPVPALRLDFRLNNPNIFLPVDDVVLVGVTDRTAIAAALTDVVEIGLLLEACAAWDDDDTPIDNVGRRESAFGVIDVETGDRVVGDDDKGGDLVEAREYVEYGLFEFDEEPIRFGCV